MTDHRPTATRDAERLEIVRTADRLAALEPAWTELWQRLDGLVFQSHAWITAWWETVADRNRRELRIGVIWRDDRLIAVVPLAIARRKGLRLLEWAAASYTDYGDILVAPECGARELQSLWVELSSAGGFDLAFLNRLLPGASARRLLDSGPSGGVRLRRNRREEVSYRVAGRWKNGAEWYDSQSKKTRKSYRHSLNTLAAAGKVQFRLLAPEEPLGPVLERLSTLKRKWLAERDHQSDLFGEQTPALARLVDTLARAGLLRIFVLESDGRLIAVSVNFVQRGTMMAFVTTYDPDFSRASPGMVLMMDYIRWALDNGLHTVDFLCGAEAFKQRFATEGVVLQSVLGTRTMLGRLAVVADNVRHTIRARQQAASAAADVESAQPNSI